MHKTHRTHKAGVIMCSTHNHDIRLALHTCPLYVLNHLDRSSLEYKYQA